MDPIQLATTIQEAHAEALRVRPSLTLASHLDALPFHQLVTRAARAVEELDAVDDQGEILDFDAFAKASIRFQILVGHLTDEERRVCGTTWQAWAKAEVH